MHGGRLAGISHWVPSPFTSPNVYHASIHSIPLALRTLALSHHFVVDVKTYLVKFHQWVKEKKQVWQKI